MYLYRVNSASTSLGKEEWKEKESNRKWHRKEGVPSKKSCPSHKFFHVLFTVTESFLLVLSWRSDNITEKNKKNTSQKEPASLSEVTI